MSCSAVDWSRILMPTISSSCPLCLGSASPRRRELLKGLGLPLRIEVADVHEEVGMGEAPLDYLTRVVDDKLSAVRSRPKALAETAAILVADTIVVIDNEILGKPCDVDDAVCLLNRLTGHEHTVFTRYAIQVLPLGGAVARSRTVASRVRLRAATQGEIRRYAQTGEGLDKAGAYAAQGIGSFLIERIDGSYTNVVGLPLCEVVLDLKDLELLADFPSTALRAMGA
jgi:septum formation protein